MTRTLFGDDDDRVEQFNTVAPPADSDAVSDIDEEAAAVATAPDWWQLPSARANYVTLASGTGLTGVAWTRRSRLVAAPLTGLTGLT